MKTYVWQRSIASWMFFPALYLVLTSTANLLWLIPAFILYLTIALTVTIGYHRLFTHNAFECSRFWHWFFGFVGCISLNAAPVHWSSVHINHHRYTDTVDDPYDSNWRHFFRFGERQNVKATKNELRIPMLYIIFCIYPTKGDWKLVLTAIVGRGKRRQGIWPSGRRWRPKRKIKILRMARLILFLISKIQY
jgi:fatty acid desaturase